MKSIAEREKANAAAPVPPGFGDGKSWRLRVVEWQVGDRHFSSLIQAGMPVHPNLHAYYWAELASYRALMAQCVKLSMFALLEMYSDTRVGAGCIDPADGPEEIAWLSCMFAEMGAMRLGFSIPNDVHIDLSAIGCGYLSVVPA